MMHNKVRVSSMTREGPNRGVQGGLFEEYRDDGARSWLCGRLRGAILKCSLAEPARSEGNRAPFRFATTKNERLQI